MRIPSRILQQIVGRPVDHFAGSGHKRALGRLTVGNSASLFVIRDNLLEDPYEVVLRDISAETVGIETPRAMMPSALLVLRIWLSVSESLAIQCRVTRCTPVPEGGFVLAAEFLEFIDPETLTSRDNSIS